MGNDYGRFAWRLGAVLWAGQIYLASSSSAMQSDYTRSFLAMALEALFQLRASPDTVKAVSLILRKTAHLAEFGILSVLVFGALGGTRGIGSDKGVLRWALGITAIYAASDEFHQLFVSGRGASPIDWCIDMIGAVCGLMLIRLHSQKRLHEFSGQGTL